MKVSGSITKLELEEVLLKFYEYFERENSSETGKAFEEFLREYLVKIGLDEVVVTQRTRDGGIDLTALRRGVGDFSDSDITNYFIQAKRNPPSSSIPPAKVRELKGTIPFGHKGIFITTAKFSPASISESSNDLSKPVVLIDGKKLVMSCIDNEIGFIYKPVFSKSEMDSVTQNNTEAMPDEHIIRVIQNVDYIEKIISSNDIRTRIVRMPSNIISQINDSDNSLQVLINDTDLYRFNIDKSRTFLGGVTEFLRRYYLLSEEGVANPQTVKWYYDKDNNLAKIYIGR